MTSNYLSNIILLFIFGGFLAQAARVEVSWNVTYVHLDRDGSGMRRAIGVDGKLPIPPVSANVGDTLVLHIHNSLDKPTSVHGHGLLQNNTNYLDGASMFTQCGIPPGQSFTYEYYLHQPGTFWLHGHYNHQNSDGMRAPLVVHDRGAPPYKYDEDLLFYLEDWYQPEYSERLKLTIGPSKVFPPPSTFPGALINGDPGNFTKPLRFTPGKTYRLRFVNMATTEWFMFKIPGHKLEVIELDGVYSKPMTVDGIDISPAQRYSVLVTAKDTDAYNYNYNITLYASFIKQVNGLNPRTYQGLVEYRKGAPVVNVADIAPNDFVWSNDIRMSALSGEEEFPVDRTISLALGGSKFTNGEVHDIINNITYVHPLIPSLYSAMTLGNLATNATLYGPETHSVILNHMEYVELELRNSNSIPHPIHLHGHTFQVIEYGPCKIIQPGFTPEVEVDSTEAPPVVRYNGKTPMSRDTILVPSGQYVKIRFRADNPGAWALHCHMDIHFGMGMAMTFIEAPDVLQKGFFKIPQRMIDHCKMLDIPVSGNGAGKQGFDLSGLREPITMAA